MAGLTNVIANADTFVVPTDALTVVHEELTRHLRKAQYRQQPDPGAPGVIAVYRRGSAAGSVFIGGSGLSAFTRTLGFITVFGLVLVATEAITATSTRVTASLVRGSHSINDTDRALDRALEALTQRGVPITEHTRQNAIALPASSPGHPRTAEALGIR